MNKVITINLDGTAYQLEDGGYDVLHAYLQTAAARLQSNPDRDEILSDIERAIAEKFRSLLGSHKTVVVTKEVAVVLAEMGPIDEDPDTSENKGESTTGESTKAEEKQVPGSGGKPKRLYRISEGAMISGVCNGIAAYLNVDPTFVRLAFVLLTIVWGTGVLVYLVMAIVVPEARSPEEKAAASGNPPTAQEFIRRAKAGYYEAMKGFPDRNARREWQRRFKRDMRANADQWQHNWHCYWTERAPVHPGTGFALPLLSLLHGTMTVLCVCTMVSLLTTGTLFGLALPANVPMWVAALLLFIAYGMVSCPLKLARSACYRGLGQPSWVWSFVFLLDAVVWVGIVAALVLLAAHYFPELREAVHNLPSVAHQAADDIRTWWNSK